MAPAKACFKDPCPCALGVLERLTVAHVFLAHQVGFGSDASASQRDATVLHCCATDLCAQACANLHAKKLVDAFVLKGSLEGTVTG